MTATPATCPTWCSIAHTPADLDLDGSRNHRHPILETPHMIVAVNSWVNGDGVSTPTLVETWVNQNTEDLTAGQALTLAAAITDAAHLAGAGTKETTR